MICHKTKPNPLTYIYIYIYIYIRISSSRADSIGFRNSLSLSLSLSLSHTHTHTHTLSLSHTHTHTHTHTLSLSLSWSPVPILHRPKHFLYTESSVRTELVYSSPCWSINNDAFMFLNTKENMVCEFVLTSPETVSPSSKMIFEMGSMWLYSCCFVGCYFQDFFNISVAF